MHHVASAQTAFELRATLKKYSSRSHTTKHIDNHLAGPFTTFACSSRSLYPSFSQSLPSFCQRQHKALIEPTKENLVCLAVAMPARASVCRRWIAVFFYTRDSRGRLELVLREMGRGIVRESRSESLYITVSVANACSWWQHTRSCVVVRQVLLLVIVCLLCCSSVITSFNCVLERHTYAARARIL